MIWAANIEYWVIVAEGREAISNSKPMHRRITTAGKEDDHHEERQPDIPHGSRGLDNMCFQLGSRRWRVALH